MKRIALEQVATTHALAETAIANRLAAIRLARDIGVSWEAIGEAMGMSRQTVQKRFRHIVDDPPSPIGLTPSR